jgi:hypothetical protein
MKLAKILLLAIAVTGIALAGDGVATPEIGVDGPSIASAVGILAGVLLIMRARRKK